MTSIPQDVITHCNRHKLCRGCPLVGGVCVAPTVSADDARWQQWVEKMVLEVRAMSA